MPGVASWGASRRADLGDLRLRVALLLEQAVHVGGDLAPEVPGGLELRPAVVEPEVHGRGRLAGEDERVGAGHAHLGGGEAAAPAVGDRGGGGGGGAAPPPHAKVYTRGGGGGGGGKRRAGGGGGCPRLAGARGVRGVN